MFGHISEPHTDLWTLIRMIHRSISLLDDSDSEIAEWLEDHPEVSRISDMGQGWIPDIITDRISNHQQIRVNLTTPSEQQIGFEAQIHYLGLTDLAMMVVIAILIIRKKRMLFPPSPNYLEPDRFKDRPTTEVIHIANICHKTIFGRVDGYTLPAPRMVLRLGLTFGARIEGLDNPQSDEGIIRIKTRSHLREADIISDIRRNNKPLDSLAQFLAKAPVTLHGLGFSRGCDLQEAILTVTDLFSLSQRIGCLPTFVASLPVEASDLTPPDTDSLPSWMNQHSDEDEEQN